MLRGLARSYYRDFEVLVVSNGFWWLPLKFFSYRFSLFYWCSVVLMVLVQKLIVDDLSHRG